MSYSEIVKNISHISEEDILKNTKNDIFLAFKEAVSNSLEAIKSKKKLQPNYERASIVISVYAKSDKL